MRYFYFFDFNLAKKETKKRKIEFLKRQNLLKEYDLNDEITLEFADKILDRIVIDLKQMQYGHAKLFYGNKDNVTLKNMILEKVINDDFFIEINDDPKNSFIELLTINSQGILTLDDKFRSVGYLTGKNAITKIILSKTIGNIKEKAFENFHHLKEVIYPKDSKPYAISPYAFENSTLKKITIPSSVQAIYEGAFYNSNLEEVVFLEESRFGYIYPYAFGGLKNLKEITLPKSIKQIHYSAFSDSVNLERVLLDDDLNIKELNLSAFTNTQITSINVPSNVEKIIYGDVLTLNKITVAPNNHHIKVIGNALYSYSGKILFAYLNNNKDEEFIMPKEVEIIERKAFFKNENLKKITFEDNSRLKTIKNYAFSETNLTEIILPKSLKEIESYAFFKSYNLEKLIFEKESELEIIRSNAFSYTNIKVVEFYDNLRSISFDVFHPSKLEKIDISLNNNYFTAIDGILYNIDFSKIVFYPPNKKADSFIVFKTIKDVSSLTKHKNLGLKEVIVEKGNEYFTSIDGILYNKDVTKLEYYPPEKEDEIYVVPESVINISAHNIPYAPNLKEIKVHPNNKCFEVIDGVLYGKEARHLIKYPDAKLDETFIFPKRTSGIGNLALYNAINLKEIIAYLRNHPFHTDNGLLYINDYETLIRYPQNKEDKHFILNFKTKKIDPSAFNNANQLENILATSSYHKELKEKGFFDNYNFYTTKEWYKDEKGNIIIKS